MLALREPFARIAASWAAVLRAAAQGTQVPQRFAPLSATVLGAPNQFRLLVSLLRDASALAAFLSDSCETGVVLAAFAGDVLAALDEEGGAGGGGHPLRVCRDNNGTLEVFQRCATMQPDTFAMTPLFARSGAVWNTSCRFNHHCTRMLRCQSRDGASVLAGDCQRPRLCVTCPSTPRPRALRHLPLASPGRLPTTRVLMRSQRRTSCQRSHCVTPAPPCGGNKKTAAPLPPRCALDLLCLHLRFTVAYASI